MQPLQSNNILGADVSNNNGSVDFSSFPASGIQFVYLKATEGSNFVDPYFSSNVAGVKAAGLPVGAYHFAHAATNSAETEAKLFLNTIKGHDLELCPVLDMEYGYLAPDKLVTWITTFKNIVEAETNMRMILYTALGYGHSENDFNDALSNIPLWNANYHSGDLTAVTLPDFGGWTDWVMWQFTDSGTLQGVNGYVDLSYARSLEAITQSLKPQYNVYQKQNDQQVFLQSFVDQTDAINYAKQWEMGSVVRISDNEWIWDNYPNT